MPLRLIIFDLDGTLVDTGIDIMRALNYAVKPYGIREFSLDETIKLVGEGTTRLIEKAIGQERMYIRDEVVGRFLDYYLNHLTDFSRVYPGVRETLEALDGYKKAVISNKREGLSRQLLSDLDLLKYFDIVVGSDTAEEKKPSPAPVFYALRRLAVMPSEAVIIGDSPLDIEAGERAGIKTIAVTYGYRERELLKGADYMVEVIGDVVPLVREISEIEERRREKRHPVEGIYGQYIVLRIRHKDTLMDALLLDFSMHGLRLECPVPFDVGTLLECVISIPKSLTKEAEFKARIRHCSGHGSSFIIGAEIEDITDEIWFRVVSKVHDFIRQRDYFTSA